MVLEVTEAMIDQAVQNFNVLGESGRIPISVNHRTAAGTLQEARAVGWIIRLFKKTENGRTSLYMEPKWLDDARQAIEQEQFRFVSCGLVLNDKNPATGESIGMHAKEVSLTNLPAIPNLAPITLTALNSSEKLALSVQTVMASGAMAGGMDLSDNGILPGSLKNRVECVTRSFYSAYPDSNEQVWIMRDISTELCIVSRRNRDGERTWQLAYSMNQGGGCDFQPMNQWTEVRQVYVPVTQSARASSGELEVELAMKKRKGRKMENGNGPGMEMPDREDMPRGGMGGKMVKTCGKMKQKVAELTARVDALIELRNYARDSRGRFSSSGGGGGGSSKGGGWRRAAGSGPRTGGAGMGGGNRRSKMGVGKSTADRKARKNSSRSTSLR